MMENRSFDHIFGYRQGVNGLTNQSNLLNPAKPESDTNPIFTVNNGAPYAVLAGQGPSHSINGTNYQLCNDKNGPTAANPAKNNGFVRNYSDSLLHDHVPHPTNADLAVVMQAFAPERLPSINALADNFCICDNWYSEVPGPTQPNRLYMHAGTSAGFGFNKWQAKLDIRTIYENMEDAGFTWGVYSFDTNEVLEFSRINTKKANFKKFDDSFQSDVTSGKLANYSFIVPRSTNSKNSSNTTGGFANSMHAPEDARYGDNLIADVYEALRSNADLFSKTLLVITFDECGGFYDHVIPPSDNIPNPDGINSPVKGDPSYAPVFSFDRLGLRVPTVLISPWIKAGTIDSTRYQHTSVLATVKKMFGLPNFLTKRDASANTFNRLFDELSAPRTDAPKKLPRVALPKISVSQDDPAHPANQRLDTEQTAMLLGVTQLTQDSHTPGPGLNDLPSRQADAHDFIQKRIKKHFGI